MNLAILAVSAFLSNGVTCSGQPISTTSAVTPRFNVTLCLTHDEPLCGIGYRFVRTAGPGTLRINSGELFLFDDPTQAINYPLLIGSATSGPDLGATQGAMPDPTNARPVGAGVARKVATFNVSVLSSKPATAYALRLDARALAVIDPDGRCGHAARPARLPNGTLPPWPIPNFKTQPLAASFTLQKK